MQALELDGEIPSLCECGCGAVVKEGRRYLVGHNRRVMRKREEVVRLLVTLTKDWRVLTVERVRGGEYER